MRPLEIGFLPKERRPDVTDCIRPSLGAPGSAFPKDLPEVLGLRKGRSGLNGGRVGPLDGPGSGRPAACRGVHMGIPREPDRSDLVGARG